LNADTQKSVHGATHWATKKEIIEAGLLDKLGRENKEGVVVGSWLAGKNLASLKTLRHNGPEHILAVGPARSGKSVGLILPTLLGEWENSTLVLDIRGENFALSAGYRKSIGQEIYRFDPTDPMAATHGTSVTFNPLEEIVLDYEPDPCGGKALVQVRGGETAEIQNLATIIADPVGKGLADHWMKTAHALLIGTITHLLYVGRNNGFCPSLADIANELSKPGVDWEDSIASWQTYPHLGYDDTGNPISHPLVAVASQEMLNRDPKESSRVLSTAVSFLTLYRDPIIAANTQVSSFKIHDLMNREKPVNLYLTVNPIDITRLLPFINIFMTQVITKLVHNTTFVSEKNAKNYKHRLLLLLDTFPSLGKLPIFEETIAFIAHYGLKAYLTVQDISQLHNVYGKNENISPNCHIQVAYYAPSPETAELLSKMSGMLLTADECRRLPGPKRDPMTGDIKFPGDMLIFPSGFAPIYGKQKPYFMDKTLMDRAKIEAPKVSDHTIDMQAKQKEVSAKKIALQKAEREAREEQERKIEEIAKAERERARAPQQRSFPPHKG
jgi:type IV secretion system protein VirD4